MASQSRVASIARILGIAALAVTALGILGVQVRLLPAMWGFGGFALGLLLGLIALILGLVGLYTTRPAGGLGGRGGALLGIAVGVGFALVVVVNRSGEYPPINDITTNTEDPPAFRDTALGYPGGEFTEQQQKAYPDLATIRVSLIPPAAYEKSLATAESLGWEVTYRDPPSGTFEATDTTAIFRFVDDIVVRVRPDTEGTTIDMRSKSRDGRGDIGANAKRIRAFRAALGQ